MRRAPALIVGGGPAGAAAAIALARAGLEPELIERSSGPGDKVCGGFLSADALSALNQLGIDVKALGARPITHLRLVSRNEQALLPLPFAAAGLSRRTLDSALLDEAARRGASIRRGIGAAAAYPACRAVRTRDGDLIGCDALFLATGKHELRGSARAGIRPHSSSVGLRTELAPRASLELALQGCVELHLFDEGYAGLLLQEDGSCNLCLSVTGRRLAKGGNTRVLVSDLLAEAPLLGERIGRDRPVNWQAVAGVPYGWSTSDTRMGVFRLGDQAGVIASIAGDGLGLALASGLSAAHSLLTKGPMAAISWQARFRRSIRRPLALAELLRRAAGQPTSRRLMMALIEQAPTIAALAASSTRIASTEG